MSLTLLAYFHALFAPTYLAGAKPRTFEAYLEAINHWAKIHGETKLPAITVEQLAKFKHDLLEGVPRRSL